MFKMWCVFFIILLIHCSGGKVYFLALDIKSDKEMRHTICNITDGNFKITRGEVINLNVSSTLSIKHQKCLLNESYQTTIIHLKSKDVKNINNRKYHTFEFSTSIPGNWACKFYTHGDTMVIQPIEKMYDHNYTVTTCNFSISVTESLFGNPTSILVGVGIGFSWIIIPILVGVVIYFKRRARSVHRLEILSAMPRPKHDRARYSGAPLKKPLITMELTERESCIYEALETERVPPEPPALETLPRGPKTMNSDNREIDREMNNINISRENEEITKPKKKSKKVNVRKKWGLGRRDQKTVEEQDPIDTLVPASDSEAKQKNVDKRTNIEIIKDRPPLPLPKNLHVQDSSGDDYEAMGSTPRGKTLQNTKTKPPAITARTPEFSKHEFKGQMKKKLPTPPAKPQEKNLKPIPTPSTPKKPVKSPLMSNAVAVNELESVLKKKGIGLGTTASVVTARPKEASPMPCLPPVATTKNPAHLSTIAIPSRSTVPKTSVPKLQPTPTVARKPIPKPLPMDAPVPSPLSTLPRPKVVEEPDENYDYQWDGEEWTYEPLPSHNYYNI